MQERRGMKQVACPNCGTGYSLTPRPATWNTNARLDPGRRTWIIVGAAGLGLAGLVAAAILAIPSVSQSRVPAPEETPTVAAPAPNTPERGDSPVESASWYAFTSDFGACSILMPQKPDQQSTIGERAISKVTNGFCILDIHKRSSDTSDVDAALDAQVTKSLETLKGTIKERRSITMRGSPGRDVTYEATLGGTHLRGRCQYFIHRGLVYELLYYSAYDDYSQSDEQRFFNSFKLLKTNEVIEETPPQMAAPAASGTPESPALPDALPGETRRVRLPDRLTGGGMVFSPHGDRLLVACCEGVVLLYDTATWGLLPTKGLVDPQKGAQPSANFLCPNVQFFGVAFSPDAKRALCWGDSRVVYEWDLGNGQLVHEYRHELLAAHAGYAPDGRLVVTAPLGTATLDGIAAAKRAGTYLQGMPEAWRIWDAQSGRELRRCEPPLDVPLDMQFSPEGDRLYLLGTRSVACVDPNTGKDRWRFLWMGQGVRLSRALCPKNQCVVLSVGRQLCIGDLKTGKILHKCDNQPTFSSAVMVTVSPDEHWAAIGEILRPLQLWDLDQRALVRELAIPYGGPTRVAFHPDGRSWVAMDRGQLRVFDLSAPAPVVGNAAPQQPNAPVESPGHVGGLRKLLDCDVDLSGCTRLLFSPDGTWIARVGLTGKISVFDTSSGQPYRTRQFLGHELHHILGVAVSRDGKTLLTTDNRGQAMLWDPATGNRVTVLEGRPGIVSCGALSPDGTLALTADGSDGAGPHDLVLWDVKTAQPVRHLSGHQHPIRAVNIVDERRAVSADSFNAAAWDLKTGRLVASLAIGKELPEAVENAHFSADGTRLLTCSTGQVRLWDLNARIVMSEFTRRSRLSMAPALSHNGQVGAFWDDQVLILRDFQSGRELDRLPMDIPPPILAFSPDDRQIAMSQPGKLSLWAVPDPTAQK
jgi:WD40 repeat protein